MEHTIALLQEALGKRGLKAVVISPRELAYWGDQGNFRLSTLPGNSRVMISHAVWLPEDKRGKGLGKRLLKTRMAALRASKVQLVLATVKNGNHKEAHLLRQRGWKRLIKFGGTSLWGKTL